MYTNRISHGVLIYRNVTHTIQFVRQISCITICFSRRYIRDYGKVTDGKLRLAPETIIIKHPSETILLALGFLPVQYTDKPVTEQGYHAEDHFEIDDGVIVQIWEIVPSEEPEPEPDPGPSGETFEEEFQRRIQEVL